MLKPIRSSRLGFVAWLAWATVCFPAVIQGQKSEIGVQLSGMHLHKIDEAPLGIGARYHYNFVPLVAADVELMHYPSNPSGNFGETTALAGVRAGKCFDSFGIFASARPGIIHFGGAYFSQRLDEKTHLMLNVGGMLEYYPNKKVFVRVDMNDAIIYYGNARLFSRLNPDPLGTVHNFQPGFGFGFRF